jgi:hypothetical protein
MPVWLGYDVFMEKPLSDLLGIPHADISQVTNQSTKISRPVTTVRRNAIRSLYKEPVIVIIFSPKSASADKFQQNFPMSNVMKIRPVVLEILNTDRRKAKLTAALLQLLFTNKPKH